MCEITETEWLRVAAASPAFDCLKDAAEDIYAPDEGKPFDSEGAEARDVAGED